MMLNRLRELIEKIIRYKNKRMLQCFFAYTIAVLLFVTICYQSSRLHGAYEGTNNSSVVFHGESLVTNLDGTDAWDDGTYTIHNRQLSLTIDGRTYYGQMDKDQKHFWLEIDNEKVWFKKY